ncbi:LysR family transcriptional regulator [Pseudomonas sp. NCCP-436]|uniref:LysR family transcriptional regulator n=1 Tax=Pseudomonas sp. NCCP-436 TaxID=2842481 RepID=UPI001C80FEE0|nr:LysR family transcriptional regulator [Pseudomonas sp. NCCP-436]GIZ13168.1 LysR family transcriptional regulator [Pseudomonas sp. NCCP-436]
MDITRLRTLRELARCGTMAATAESLHLTPSAVSQQIAQLEREAEVALIERRGRGVVLTPAGERLAGHVERIMVVLDEARSELAQMRSEIAGELRVAAFPSIAVAVVAETVRALRSAYPKLEVVVVELEPQESLSALGGWQIDVAVIDDLAVEPDEKHEHYGLIPLTQDLLHVLLPADHPLASREGLSIADLRDEAWALDSTSSSFGEFITNLCRRSGYAPRINAHCTGFEMVAAMVASGNSISVVSGLRLVHPLHGVMAVPLLPGIRRGVFLAYRKGERDHPAVNVFIDEAVYTADKVLSQYQLAR